MDCKSGRHVWAVGLAAFLTHFCTWSFSLTVGVFYTSFRKEFQENNSVTSCVRTLNWAFCCAAGPLASLIITYRGCRFTIILGALLGSLGIFISSFAGHISVLLIFFGVVSGIGFCLNYTAAVVTVTQNVKGPQVSVLALSMCGLGLAVMTYPVFNTYLIEEYTWRGAFMILSALNLHAVVAGLLIPQHNCQKASSNLQVYHEIQKKVCRDIKFWILCFNEFSFTLGMNVFYTHATSFAKANYLGYYKSAMMLSVTGITSIIGRLALCVFALWYRGDMLLLYMSAYLTCGICIMLYAMCTNFAWMLLCCAVYGFCISAYTVLAAEVTRSVCGDEKLAVAYGNLLLPMAIGTLVGPPTGGWLYDITGFYPSTFYFGGGVTVFGAISLTLILILRRTIKRENGQNLHPIQDRKVNIALGDS